MTANAAAVRLVAKLRDKVPDSYTMMFVQQLEEAILLMPMSKVLAKVPGETITIKAENVGVSRNTWYSWWRGEIRPNKTQAARLEHITGIPAEKFQGRR